MDKCSIYVKDDIDKCVGLTFSINHLSTCALKFCHWPKSPASWARLWKGGMLSSGWLNEPARQVFPLAETLSALAHSPASTFGV